MKHFNYLSFTLLLSAMSLLFISCSDNEDKLSQKTLYLISGQSTKLIYDGDCTWKSDEPMIAEVDDFGKVTANRVGKTTIWANDESCEVEVTPRYKTYMEPCMDWGASESEVTDFMNGYRNLGENGNTLGFSDQDNEIVYMYVFENNSLSSSAIGAKFLSKGEEITNFLLERYVPISIDDSSYIVYMTNIDKTIGVVVSINASSGLMMVLYTPFSNDNIDTRTTFTELNRHVQCGMVHSEKGSISMMNKLFDKFKKY